MIPKLILASNSPRRRQLLALTGWPFSIRPVEIDESPLPDEPPAEYVLRLAASKARAAGAQASPGEIILTADTTVADGVRILGKPEDAAEARAMLRALRGRPHTVYTAIGVYASRSDDENGPDLRTDLCSTQVWMREYSDEEIESYIASGDPFDKAGGYAIQSKTFQPVAQIEGCYACVVGLPLCHVVRALGYSGLQPAADVATACAHELAIDSPCPAVEDIFRASQSGESGGANPKDRK